MTKTELLSPSGGIEVSPDTALKAQQRTLGRNAVLRALLDEPYMTVDHPVSPGNYETAQDAGIIDAFYFNPDTGEDAATHILAGQVIRENGAEVATGYHHEPSALEPGTGLDTARMAARKGKGEFRQFPYEPYERYTTVGGYRKESHSVMFPSEYDGLAILSIIKNARDNRDRTADQEGRDGRVVADVEAPLLDGKSTMKMRLILDKDTDKIVTAMPRAKKRQLMKDLSPADIKTHLGLDN